MSLPPKKIWKVIMVPLNNDGIMELSNDDDSTQNPSEDEYRGLPNQTKEVNLRLIRDDGEL
jgi:hypothetical protein